MGINSLWELLEPAAKTVPVISLALQDRYIGPTPHLPYVVGVDASSTFLSDTIKIYTVDAIQEEVDHSLTGDAFITIAICCGGDYDKNGLPGCGCKTALGLARCLDNDMLHRAMHSGNQDQSIQQWQSTTEYYLASDPTGKMGQSHPVLAHSLPDSFPNPGIINLYVHPAVTLLTELPKLQPPAPSNLAQLAALIQQLLGWDSKKLLSTFRTIIWPVIILHELLEDLVNNSPMSNEIDLGSGCTRAVFLNCVSCPKKTLAGISGQNNDVPTNTLEQATSSCLKRQLKNAVRKTHISDPQIESNSLSTSCVVRGSSAGAVSVAAASSANIIDLTQEEDEVALADGIVIDLTGDDDDSELIDLTL
ncbi:hypothetical protein EV702DRAFT_1198789 [Suillus placidus]|uniref:Uncharacterized protein n=1 Tax=Suillus placidus TaxID=48579 RepID=A0A9P6ZSM0_9AGAM|nr:hypothetical protein EV702DRAFT_1198789 [Suillus placidus]